MFFLLFFLVVATIFMPRRLLDRLQDCWSEYRAAVSGIGLLLVLTLHAFWRWIRERETHRAAWAVATGLFGGAVANPNMVLAQILSQMKDRSGRVKITGFYDDVRELSQEERDAWKKLPFNEKQYRKDLDAPKLFGETGYTTLERVWGRPTFEVNGLLGGFTGEGAKTVIPAVAMAKVSMPLASDPEQDVALLGQLDALGDDLERQGLAEVDDRGLARGVHAVRGPASRVGRRREEQQRAAAGMRAVVRDVRARTRRSVAEMPVSRHHHGETGFVGGLDELEA